jgi:hypothetical protein
MSIWDDNEDPFVAAERRELQTLRAEVERLNGVAATLRELRTLDAAEIERLNIRIRQDAEAALQYLNEIDRLRAEVELVSK